MISVGELLQAMSALIMLLILVCSIVDLGKKTKRTSPKSS